MLTRPEIQRPLPTILSAVLLSLLSACATNPVADTRVLDVIAFGSCVHQDQPQPIWTAVNAEGADLFMFLGDNVYGDTEDMTVLQAQYDKLAANTGFAKLVRTTPVVAIWDDHDFGVNNGGAEYPMKAQSRDVLLNFFDEPADSERRHRDDGIYITYRFGPPGRQVQIILLDLRWNRSPLIAVDAETNASQRQPANLGPMIPDSSDDAVLLGESQWQWLEQQLLLPADIRIIASSVQLLSKFTGWESWANFPAARERLFALLRRMDTNGVLIVSGDTHWAELSRYEAALDYPLYEVTSSGLTEEWQAVSPNPYRIGAPYASANYGLIEIDWTQQDPAITLSVKDVGGSIVLSHRLRLSNLQTQ